MEHRILYRLLPWHPHSHHLLRRIVLLVALFVLVLEAAALAQNTLPPPPPADATTAAPGQNPAPAENDVRAVRVTDVAGQVQVWQNGQIAFSQAEPNMPAVEGMRFVTGEDGRLEIEFEDGSVARLAPNSSFRLTQLRRDALGNTITRIDALTGLSYYELNGRDGQFAVGLDQETAAPEGGAIFRVDLDSDPSELAVMQGEVHVGDGEGVSVDVHPDQTFQTDPDEAGEFTVADSITANSWDQWNSDRDQALADMESSETTARASTTNPDDASWNDLDYYGSWYNVPGYGEVWSPNGVGADWDPFGDGYWGYYPAFGYTWISAYPWGWWPYHCGAWDYMNAWGWIWAPGNCGWGLYGGGWMPYPTVGSHPPAYRPPMRPRKPGPGLPRPRLIAVHRGAQYAAPFQYDRARRVQPRPLDFSGTMIAPLETGVHPLQRGPLGETFTAALVREHPELAPAGVQSGGMPSVHVPAFGVPGNRGATVPGYHPPRPAPASRSGEAPRPSGGAPRAAAPGGGGKPHR
ncbi:MAG TPA: DUF6600 domain-containing protein [Acidobacteriaceae bacterium]|nr:DUF6600 domain-containing protein [Acidobacteriaceae bacterium]